MTKKKKKEQNKSPETDTKETEIYKVSDKEFKIAIMDDLQAQ